MQTYMQTRHKKERPIREKQTLPLPALIQTNVSNIRMRRDSHMYTRNVRIHRSLMRCTHNTYGHLLFIAHTHVYIYTCIYVYIYIRNMHTHTHTYINVYIYISRNCHVWRGDHFRDQQTTHVYTQIQQPSLQHTATYRNTQTQST